MDEELERWQQVYDEAKMEKRAELNEFFDRVNVAKRLKSWCDKRWNPEKETCEDCLGIKYPELCFYIPDLEGEETVITHCPFCGGQASLQTKDSTYFVKCKDCGSTGPVNNVAPMLAVVAWNKRYTEDK